MLMTRLFGVAALGFAALSMSGFSGGRAPLPSSAQPGATTSTTRSASTTRASALAATRVVGFDREKLPRSYAETIRRGEKIIAVLDEHFAAKGVYPEAIPLTASELRELRPLIFSDRWNYRLIENGKGFILESGITTPASPVMYPFIRFNTRVNGWTLDQ